MGGTSGIDLSEARQCVDQALSDISPPGEGDALVILDAETMEKAWGWVFFYTSKRYLKAGDIRHALAGKAPLWVERETGLIRTLGTACQLGQCIRTMSEQAIRVMLAEGRFSAS